MRVVRVDHQEKRLAGGLRLREKFSGELGVQIGAAAVFHLAAIAFVIKRRAPRRYDVFRLAQNARQVTVCPERLRQSRHATANRIEAQRAIVVR